MFQRNYLEIYEILEKSYHFVTAQLHEMSTFTNALLIICKCLGLHYKSKEILNIELCVVIYYTFAAPFKKEKMTEFKCFISTVHFERWHVVCDIGSDVVCNDSFFPKPLSFL